ncbi:GNAT family N-acetyltransferase [Candidatus Methylopumilus planktonicus]|uniref:GNAT family N-acetyltransferase n=1 Tax=Candidatus Methylopumilus planktonicus TaxID=1581557 RepID=UPI003D189F54
MTSEIDPRDIFLKGKHVILKVLTREDVIDSGWYGWFNDEELCKTLQKHYFPTTVESQLVFWEQNVRSVSDKIQLGICSIKGGPIVGVISLNNIDFINSRAEISVVIGEREEHNVKIFTESCMLIFNHGFYSLNLNRIYGGSISKDLVLMMCRMFNCQQEGVKRQEIFKNGIYYDTYCYGLLREEFPQLTKDITS